MVFFDGVEGDLLVAVFPYAIDIDICGGESELTVFYLETESEFCAEIFDDEEIVEFGEFCSFGVDGIAFTFENVILSIVGVERSHIV